MKEFPPKDLSLPSRLDEFTEILAHLFHFSFLNCKGDLYFSNEQIWELDYSLFVFFKDSLHFLRDFWVY